MIMVGSIFLLFLINEWMHFQAHSQNIQMGEVEDIEFFHDGLSMCVWTNILDNSDDFFLCSDKRL